jgi:hypothetical protein
MHDGRNEYRHGQNLVDHGTFLDSPHTLVMQTNSHITGHYGSGYRDERAGMREEKYGARKECRNGGRC